MLILLSITGATDGYGLGRLYEILAPRFSAARTSDVGVLRTHGNMSDLYQADLAGGSQLTVVRSDPSGDERTFAITVVTHSRAFADRLRHDFKAPGVEINFKDVEVREVGEAPASATTHA